MGFLRTSCWQGQEFRNFILPGFVGPPALPDAGGILEFPLCGPPVLSLGLSGIFCGSQSSLCWMAKSREFHLLYPLPAVALMLWLIHVLCAECCVIDYSGETGLSIDR